MTKVGIVTIADEYNYGNRLQNYALQQVLSRMGITSVTLKNDKRLNNKEKVYIKSILLFIKYKIGFFIKCNKRRLYNFHKFNKENIRFNKFYITPYSCNLNNKYDYFIVGSDQVWKPIFKRMSDVDMLCFASDEKKISYAASFGISKIPKEYIDKLKKGVENFKAISVREDAGKRILQEIVEKDVQVVLDPTMLLTKEEWLKVAKKPKKLINNKYILTYFLGNNEIKEKLEQLSKDKNFEIINLMDNNSKYYEYGPSEFLYLFNNAEFIYTDSFHACVFSMLFEKKFFVLDRNQYGAENDMSSRIDSLLRKFEITNRKIKNTEIEKALKETIDYKKILQILQQERNESIAFLKEALDIKE